MGWAFCGDVDGRPVGYGVVAKCDFPGCEEMIDRGLAYLCGEMHDPTEWGCGKYFCGKHREQAVHKCEFPREEGAEDEQPCKPGEHKWTGKQMGGPPDAAESYEWVEYCDVCGVENPGSYDHDANYA